MRYAVILFAATMLPPALLAAAASSPAAAMDLSLATNFTVDAKTTIPGAVLLPGQYTISVIEHLTDRVILQVSDKNGKVQSTFLGLTNSSLTSAGQGPVIWAGKLAALRGFTFPGASPVEFVYPKTQAVAIAKGNLDKVLAIDPASDNLSITHDKLSTQDMQIVTLWTLKSTRVGPDSEPAIEATRYQVPSLPAPATAAPSLVANAAPAPVRPASTRQEISAKSGDPSSPQAPLVSRKHVIAVLPHTASNFPLLLLCSVLSLFGAATFRTRRLYSDVR